MSRWTRFPIPLGQGVDTKSDDKSLQPGKLTTLENAVFTSPGRLRKRNGYASFAKTVEGTGSISSAVSIVSFNKETLLFDGTYAYTHLDDANKWKRIGIARSLQTTATTFVGSTYAFHNPDVAMTGSLAVYAYEVYDQGFKQNAARCTVVNTKTNAVLINNQILSTNATTPRCAAMSGSLYVVYGDVFSNNLLARRIDPSTPSVLQAPVTLATDLFFQLPSGFFNSAYYDSYGVGPQLEVMGLSDRLVVLYANNNSGTLATYVSSTLTFVTNSRVQFADSYGFGCLWTDPQENIWAAGMKSGIGAILGTAAVGTMPIVGAVFNKNLVTIMTATNIASSSVDKVMRMGGVSVSSSMGSLYYEVSSSQDISRYINVSRFGPAALPSSTSFIKGLAMESKPFAWSGTNFLWTMLPSADQPTFFMLDADTNVASKAAAGSAYRFSRKGPRPSNIATPFSGGFAIASQKSGRLLSETGSLFRLPGVAGTLVDFTATTGSFAAAKLGKQMHVAGGVMTSYDGFSFVEHGFNTYPERLSASLNYSNGNLCSGSYLYIATYEWTDTYGQIHRSRPSEPFALNIISGTMITGSADITVSTLKLTQKELRSPVTINIWRTENLGETFYKVTPVTSGVFYNTSSIDTVTYRDSVNDLFLISNELFYTTHSPPQGGDPLQNDEPPGCTMMCSWKNRIWIGGLEDASTLAYSKTAQSGEPVTFSDLFTLEIDSAGGAITAIQGMEEVLLVFKEHGIHRVFSLTSDGTPYGGGPDNTGSGGTWTQTPINSDVGCVDANSVCLTDRGVFFKSAKGIYLIDRGMQVSYVGAAVEGYNNLTITSAVLVADSNQVRFTTSDGSCLVYDYLMDQWSTFTGLTSVDSCVTDGHFQVLRSDGTVLQETINTFNDDGGFIRMVEETGWIAPFGPQGYMRAKSVSILGDYEGSHLLNAYVAYDYNPNVWHTCSFDATSIVTQSPTREGNLYEFRAHFPIQKCTAIKLRIEDAISGSATRGYSISQLSVDVKQKQGSNKLRPARNRGAP